MTNITNLVLVITFTILMVILFLILIIMEFMMTTGGQMAKIMTVIGVHIRML